MTENYFVSCNECETKINLRAQIGYYNIPFNLHCPKCNTHIYGKLIINQEQRGMKLELENAHIVANMSKSKGKLYCAELGAEFPTCKMYLRDFDEYMLPPYLANMTFYSDEKKGNKCNSKRNEIRSIF